MTKLPSRQQWYKDMVANLRADRSAGDISPSEFFEHAADEIERRHQDGDPYWRSLAIADVARYDRAVSKAQRDAAADDAATEEAVKWIKRSLFPDEILIKLGLDPDINLGFDRRVPTLDASHEQRLKGIEELRRKMTNSTAGTQKRIDALERADYLAGDKTLREIIDNRPEEYGYGVGAL
jgi:hypothetical protein